MAKSIRKQRPFSTDYGHSKGFCKTPTGAKIAACTYLIKNNMRHCVIGDLHGSKADVFYNGFWGLTIAPIHEKPKLRRVA